MSSTPPRAVTAVRGRVTAGDYARGTKSERAAVFITVDGTRYVLRRKTGPAFGDDSLARFVGRVVECDGFIVGTTLLAERIDPVD